jgi:hypothetical protein
MQDYKLASEAFQKSVKNRLDHTNSHYALSSAMQLQDKRIEAMIPLYFFLMLEPDSDRSQRAVINLEDLWSQGVNREQATGNVQINLASPKGKGSDPMRSAELMVSMLQAKSLESSDNPDLIYSESYVEKLRSLFNYLGQAEWEGRDDFYTQYYIPFFYRLVESEYFEAFVHYILQSKDEESNKWVKTNTDKLEAMFDWLDDTEE